MNYKVSVRRGCEPTHTHKERTLRAVRRGCMTTHTLIREPRCNMCAWSTAFHPTSLASPVRALQRSGMPPTAYHAWEVARLSLEFGQNPSPPLGRSTSAFVHHLFDNLSTCSISLSPPPPPPPPPPPLHLHKMYHRKKKPFIALNQ